MASINGSYISPVWWKRIVFIWEIIILYWAFTGKIEIEWASHEFTKWKLPKEFKLKYVDFNNWWGVSRHDETNDPFETDYINPVYCKKGLIYSLFNTYMQKEASKIRGIKNWKNLEIERRKMNQQTFFFNSQSVFN